MAQLAAAQRGIFSGRLRTWAGPSYAGTAPPSALMDDASRGIANPLVEVVNFVSRRANVFHESTPPIYRLNPHLGFELTELLGLADPRPHVNLRIRDGHG